MDVIAIMDHKLKNINARRLITLLEPLEERLRGSFPGFTGSMSSQISVLPPNVDHATALQRWKAIEANEDVEPIEVNWALGTIYVCRHCFVFSHNHYHKYRNLFHLEVGKEILNVNRAIASELSTSEILYIPDGYFETAILENGPDEGKNTRQTIDHGIELFGNPPPDINRGRANYFFVDDLKQSLEGLQPFENLPKYWVYDQQHKEYVRADELDRKK